MHLDLSWNGKMAFTARAGGHEVLSDARTPIGEGKAMSPKELLLAAVSGCTAMDVAALLRKHRQPLQAFEVHADASLSQGSHPVTFSEVTLVYDVQGEVDPAVVLEAVKLSQTRFCGVSAMLSRAVPIRYEVRVNGTAVGTGQSDFEAPDHQP
ncbi:MAG: OsmC family protein [Polyangiaceae bacterium]|nr:OsmC family protein [Polyangiaceae bacterium]